MPPTETVLDRNGGFANRQTGRAAEAPTGDYYLVAIAVDAYENPALNLANPVRDAEAVVRLLTTVYGGEENGVTMGFTPERTKTFFNAAANEDDLVAYLESLNVGPDDALLIYFAGHGKEKYERLNLCLSNFDAAKKSTYFDVNDLHGMFKPGEKFRDVLVVLDCCYAGTAAVGYGQVTDKKHCRRVLMSTGSNRTASDGSPTKGSPFANALLDSLRQSPQPDLGSDELFGNLSTRMKRQLEVSNRGQANDFQTPKMAGLPGTDSGSGQFWFRRCERHLPPDLLRNSLMYYFNFHPQRSTAARYKAENHRFNVINSVGKSANEQKILARFFFHYLLKKKGAKVLLSEQDVCRVVQLTVQSPDNIWADLCNQWKPLGRTEPEHLTPADLVRCLLDHLADTAEATPSANSVLIFWLHLAESTRSSVEQSVRFCNDLMSKLNTELQALDEVAYPGRKTKLLQAARVFAFVSESREGDTSLVDDAWFETVRTFGNALVFKPIESVFEGTVDDWLDDDDNRAQMDHPAFKALQTARLLPNGECSLEAFVETLVDELKYPDEVANQFLTQLYQLDNPKMF